MPDQPLVRIFISSPADVRPERLKAEQIVKRLNREFGHYRHVEAVLWEREPLVASHAFQDPENIPQPRLMNIVVVILWSRLGLMLPAERFRGAISKQPVTGTEWEFEDALAGARANNGVPHLILYRKTAEPSGGFGDRAAVEERLGQIEQVEGFIKRWFRSEGDESFTAAFHTFANTAEFEEQLYGHLRALLQQPPPGEHPVRWHEAPFRGLLSFEFEQAPVFFGRRRASNELRELLAQRAAAGCAFALVLGASGSGKSSLVKAGLLPDLILPGMIGHVGIVRWAVLRPSDAEPYEQLASSPSPPTIPLRVGESAGTDGGPAKNQAVLFGGNPLDALAAAIMAPTALPELAELQYTPQRLAALLREAPAQAELPIRQGLAKAGAAAGLTQTAEARLALVIDQLEELFTIERLTQSGRETFIAALGGLARSGLVWVVATMRSDFFDRLETAPDLVALSAGARFLLLPPDDDEITQIIRQPALEAGLRFEIDTERGIALDRAICQAAAGQKGALPLLSFLLDQLWRRRDDRQLTFAAYEDLGGLEGAIGRRAEEVFLSLPQAVQDQFVPVLRALVTVEGATATSRPAPLSLFPLGSPRWQLVDALLHPDARLLVAEAPQVHERNTARPQDQARLRLAHEAFLTHWPRARDQIAADARDLELRGRLEKDAARWEAAPTRRNRRHRTATGLLLAEARALIGRWGAELPAEVLNFVAASRRAARQRSLRRAGTLIGALLALPLIIMFIWAGLMWWGVSRVEAEWAAEDEFIRIPPVNLAEPYCFNMGSPDSEPGRFENEGPVHGVCLKPFELGKYVVTQSEWNRVMILPWLATSSYFPGQRHPVDSVSWDDAQTFIRLMSFFGRNKYRLPSEAEWEYAARAGTTTAFFWGANVDDGCAYAAMADASVGEVAVGALAVDCHYPKATAPSEDSHGSEGLFEKIKGTTDVGAFKANPWGLYDMSGNVFQWVADCYVNSYVGAATDGSMVSVEDCNTHVVRGGSFDFNPMRILRTAYRSSGAPVSRYDYIGVRLVRTERNRLR
jgi:formylglycine-generating enzyme required for sulfatase activity